MPFNNYGIQPNPYYQQPYVNNTQYQPQFVQPQPTMLVGRVVNDVTDIRPNETPTTGQPAVFPKADGSVVYLTMMDNTGRIITREYVPKEIPTDNKAQSDVMTSMQEQLNRIENMLSRRNNQSNAKKGD